MPQYLVVCFILLDRGALAFLDLNINSALPEVKCNRDPLESLEPEVAVLVGLNLEREHIFVLFL